MLYILPLSQYPKSIDETLKIIIQKTNAFKKHPFLRIFVDKLLRGELSYEDPVLYNKFFKYNPSWKKVIQQIKQDKDFNYSVNRLDKKEVANRLFLFCQRYIEWTGDPFGTEGISDPTITLIFLFGDCDDIALLLGTMLMSVGIEIAYKVVSTDPVSKMYNHIYIIAYLPSPTPLDPTRKHFKLGDEPIYYVSKIYAVIPQYVPLTISQKPEQVLPIIQGMRTALNLLEKYLVKPEEFKKTIQWGVAFKDFITNPFTHLTFLGFGFIFFIKQIRKLRR
ncbi:MAG: hypothetical protein ABIM49_02370 [candidate division WOR-3 bacterium]